MKNIFKKIFLCIAITILSAMCISVTASSVDESLSSNEYITYTSTALTNKQTKIRIPENAEQISVNKVINPDYSDSEYKWYKFISISNTVCITQRPLSDCTISLYDSNGNLLSSYALGFGASYHVAYGKTYYLYTKNINRFEVIADISMPTWNDDNDVTAVEPILFETNVYKTFDGDENTYWNVYKFEGTVDIDFNGGYTYESLATMRRVASPVNIHMESKVISSNNDIIHTEYFKYDPNNKEECEELGASTSQNTMKDRLNEGEKEYRFDNIYFMIPVIGTIELTEERLLYIPVGYTFSDSHVIKCDKHPNRTVTKENIVNPTCTEAGSYTENIFCLECNKSFTAEKKLESLGHDEIWHKSQKATCTEIGWESYTTCSRCTYTTYKEIPAKQHNYDAKIAVFPTCKDKGTMVYFCYNCGDNYTEEIEINPENHSGNTKIKDYKASTCTSEGYSGDIYCADCDKKINSGSTTPKSLHNYKSEIVLSPTCTSDGIIAYTCSCQSYYTESILSTGHSYSINGVCSACFDYNKDYDNLNAVESCSCKCHKSGFMGFIWKLINFFNKLFKNNKTCACGVAHY